MTVSGATGPLGAVIGSEDLFDCVVLRDRGLTTSTVSWCSFPRTGGARFQVFAPDQSPGFAQSSDDDRGLELARALVGVGEEFVIVGDQVFPRGDSPCGEALQPAEGRFDALADQWERETANAFDFGARVMHPAYQQIIGMGGPAVGPILRRLQRSPDHWFWALHSITGVNPVPAEAEGNLQRMAAAWIAWGRDHGYMT